MCLLQGISELEDGCFPAAIFVVVAAAAAAALCTVWHPATHLVSISSNVSRGWGSHASIVDDVILGIVAQQVVRQGGCASSLDLVLVPAR